MKKFEILGAAALAAVLANPAAAAELPPALEQLHQMALPAGPIRGAATAEGGTTETSSVTGATVEAEVPRLWFVELRGKPMSEGGRSAALDKERATFKQQAKKAGLAIDARSEFRRLFNGYTVAANRGDLEKISKLGAVANVFPVVEVRPEEDTNLYTALGMTGADIAQSSLGLSGAGVNVAVMDSGIDWNHPDLGGCFGKGCKVARGFDFVGDAFNADPSSGSYNPVAQPDDNPDDCGGHGTHVAGIVAANGTVVGVAPRASLSAYRVFGCNGSTTADIMLKAMEKTLADGNTVLNMSIGSSFQWPGYPTAVAADRLVANGVMVVTSIGNSGTSGIYAAGAPGVGREVFGNASVENTTAVNPAIGITQGGTTTLYGYTASANPPPASGTEPLARTGTTVTTNDACAALTPGSLTGQVALIRRGTCSFYIKTYNAQSAGATAVILYNNTTGSFSPSLTGSPAVTIPVIAVTSTVGAAIDTAIQAGGATVTWGAGYVSTPNTGAGLISSFSSYGPTYDLAFKPDATAPGGNIFSTYPLEQGGYANLSGTSMASPHVAGAVALIKQMRPGWTVGQIRTALQNTADPFAWSLSPSYTEAVHRQGAGLIDVDEAATNKVFVTPPRLALGEFETAGSTKTVPIKIQNLGPTETFTLTYQNAIETYGQNRAPSFNIGCHSVSFGTPTIKVPTGTAATFNAIVQENGCVGANLIFGGYVVLTGDLGTVRRVPLIGYSGNLSDQATMTSGGFGFPLLGYWLGGSSYGLASSPYTYSFTNLPSGNDHVQVLVHLEEGARRLFIETRPAGSSLWRPAFNQDFVPRSTTSSGFYAFEWRGMTPGGPVPDGIHELRVCILSPRGDISVANDVECVQLPNITVDRP